MAEKRGDDGGKNPFSFKSFLTKEDKTLKEVSTSDKERAGKSVQNHNKTQNDSLGVKDTRAPNAQITDFADESFMSSDKRLNPFSFNNFVQETVVGDDVLPSNSLANEAATLLKGVNSTANDDIVDLLPDLLDNLDSSSTTKIINEKHKQPSARQQNITSSASGTTNAKKEYDLSSIQRSSNLDLSSDSDDDFSVLPNKTKASLLPDISHDNPVVILEDLQGLTKNELIRKINQVREENEKLLRKELSWISEAKLKTERISELEQELVNVRRKEAEETAALESAILQVEASLKTSNERFVEAEKAVKTLRHENKSLQETLKVLKKENADLTARDNLSPNSNKEQLKYVSDQLKGAAVNAEQSLKQLMSGVDHLKLMSQTLVSLDKFQEIPPDHAQE